MNPSKDFDQRAFPRTVLAEERMDFPGAQFEIDATQRGDASEMFGDAVQLEQWRDVRHQLFGEFSGVLPGNQLYLDLDLLLNRLSGQMIVSLLGGDAPDLLGKLGAR